MSKVILDNIDSILGNPSSAQATVNRNNDKIEEFSDTVLSRKGQKPNHMESVLDMNHHDIWNVNKLFARKVIVGGKVIGGSGNDCEIDPTESFGSILYWCPVLSMTLKTPPVDNKYGDIYYIPEGSLGDWGSHIGELAVWTNLGWDYTLPVEGHGIGLVEDDCDVYIYRNNKYQKLKDTIISDCITLPTVSDAIESYPVYIVKEKGSDCLKLAIPSSEEKSTTYYLSPDGDDSNPGDTSNRAFKTFQGAIDKITKTQFSSSTIELFVLPGQYDGMIIKGSQITQWKITGLSGNPDDVMIDGTKEISQGRGLFINSRNTTLSINGVSASGILDCFGVSQGVLNLKNCHAVLSGTDSNGVSVYQGGSATVEYNFTVSGSGRSVFNATQSSSIRLGYEDLYTSSPIKIISNNATVNNAVIYVTDCSSATIVMKQYSYQGNINGNKCYSILNAIISCNGGPKSSLIGTTQANPDTKYGGQIFDSNS